MQAALKVAITAPIDIVRLAYKAIALHKELAEKGSKLAVSDVAFSLGTDGKLTMSTTPTRATIYFATSEISGNFLAIFSFICSFSNFSFFEGTLE